MKKVSLNKFFRLFITVFCLVVMTSVLLVACTKKKDNNKQTTEQAKPAAKELTKDLIIPNSDFNVTDDAKGEYPASMTKWSNKSIFSKNSSKIKAGGIYTDQENYDKHSKSWDDADGSKSDLYNKIKAAPNKPKKLAMIYNPKDSSQESHKGASAHALTNSFDLTPGFLYKVSIDVMTYNLEGMEEKQDYYDEKVKKPGAWLSLTSGTTQKFKHINTNGEWKTYTFYIQAPHRKTNLTLEMTLGNLDSPDSFKKGYLATGHAFFGNIKAEKIAKDKIDETINEYNTISNDPDKKEFAKFADMRLDNRNFEYYGSAYIGSGSAPEYYQVKRGTDKDDPNPPDVSAKHGVIKADKFDQRWTNFGNDFNVSSGSSNTIKENSAIKSRLDATFDEVKKPHGNATATSNVYLLSQSMMSASELQSKSKITIEPGKKYRISTWLYTYNINGGGVTLTLRGENTNDITIEGISKNTVRFDTHEAGKLDSDRRPYAVDGASNGAWKEYIFEIDATDLKYAREYIFSLALGTGGPKANNKLTYPSFSSDGKVTTKEMYNGNGTFSSGYVFANSLKFETFTEALSGAETHLNYTTGKYAVDGESSNKICVKLHSDAPNTAPNGTNDFNHVTPNELSDGTDGMPHKWQLKEVKGDYYISKDWAKAGAVDLTNLDDKVKKQIGEENAEKMKKQPAPTNKPVMMMSVKDYPAGVFAETKDGFDIEPYSITKVSFYAHTSLTDNFYKAGFARFYTKDDKDNKKELINFSDIKTKGKNEYYNEWEEFTFYIKNSTGKKQTVFMSVSLGKSEQRYKPEDAALGTMFFTEPTFEEITDKTYTSVSGSNNAKKYEIREKITEVVSNHNFDNLDMSKLNGNVDSNGMLRNAPVAPDSWEGSDRTFSDPDFINGIVEFERGSHSYSNTDPEIKEYVRGAHINSVFGTDASEFDNIFGPRTDDYQQYCDERGYFGPRMLALGSKNPAKKFSYGYTSKKFKLEGSKFYKISVFARSIKEANFTLSLIGSGISSVTNSKKVITQKGSSGMQRYDFYVRTGIDSTTVQLNYWLGYNERKYEASNPDLKGISHKSGGYALFSSVLVDSTLTEDEFNNATETERVAKLEANHSTFDITSLDADKRTKLTTPEAWSPTYKNSNLSTSGLLASDETTLPKKEDDVNTEDIDESKYLSAFGNEKYTDEKFKPEFAEVERVKWLDKDNNIKDPEYDGLSDDQIAEKLRKKRFKEYIEKHWLEATKENLDAAGNNSSYALYNKEDATSILKKKSVTLKANKTYKFTVKLRTKLIREAGLTDEDFKEKGAFLKMKFNEHNAPVEFRSIKKDEYTEYTYYIKTPSSDVSTTFTASLGREGADAADEAQYKTAGWLHLVSAGFNEVDPSEFKTNADTEFVKYVSLGDAPKSGNKDKANDLKKEEKSASFNTEALWWMIPTIILGILIIAVIIVFIYKRFRKKQGKLLIEYLRETEDASDSALEQKHEIYTQDDSEPPKGK